MNQPVEPTADPGPPPDARTDGEPPGARTDGEPADAQEEADPDAAPLAVAPTGPADPAAVPPWAPPAGWAWVPEPEPVDIGRTALVMTAIAAAVTLLGVPFGLLWSAIAPDVPVIATDRGPVYGEAQPEQVVAADGWFAILALPVGLVAAIGVWLLARQARGAPGLVALTIGAIGTGLVGWWVGRQIGLADFESALAAAGSGTRLDQPPDLAVAELGWWPPQVLGVLLVPALAAAATYTMLAAWSRFPSLRPEPEYEPEYEPAPAPGFAAPPASGYAPPAAAEHVPPAAAEHETAPGPDPAGTAGGGPARPDRPSTTWADASGA